MKKLLSVVGLVLCLSGINIAAAQQGSEVDAGKYVLPVLVAVDASGAVTKIDPAIELLPAQKQAIERAVKQMITGPATDQKNRKVRSQLVLRFSMQPAQGSDGAYEFTYLDAMPIQSGSVHWVNTTDGFALASGQAVSPNMDLERSRREALRHMNLRHRSMKHPIQHTPDNYPNPADDP